MIIGVKRWAIMVGLGCIVTAGVATHAALEEDPCTNYMELYGLTDGREVVCEHPAQVMDVHPMTNGGMVICRCPNTPESGQPLKK